MTPPTVRLLDLDRIATHVSEAQQLAATVQALTLPGQPLERAGMATGLAEQAASAAGHALAGLQRLGARLAPVNPGASPAAVPVPLHLLDTPDTRRLLALLEEAQQVAERIDRERGRTVGEEMELPPGQSRGTDLAETISEIALRVRTEVHGPKGRE